MTHNKSLEEVLQSVRGKVADANGPATHLANLSDASILAAYENIRQQVDADQSAGQAYRLLGEAAKERAEILRAEMVKRAIQFTPINWP